MLCRLRVTSVTMRYTAAELSLGVDCQSRSRKGSCPTDKAIWLLFGSRNFISAKVFSSPGYKIFAGGFFCWWLKKAAFWFFPPTRRACWAFWFLMKKQRWASEIVTIVAVHEDDGNGDDYGDDWSRGWPNNTKQNSWQRIDRLTLTVWLCTVLLCARCGTYGEYNSSLTLAYLDWSLGSSGLRCILVPFSSLLWSHRSAAVPWCCSNDLLSSSRVRNSKDTKSNIIGYLFCLAPVDQSQVWGMLSKMFKKWRGC